jgi:hypothetical protein
MKNATPTFVCEWSVEELMAARVPLSLALWYRTVGMHLVAQGRQLSALDIARLTQIEDTLAERSERLKKHLQIAA